MIKNVIIGGGISGLSCAYHLKKSKKDYLVLEKSAKLGGYCSSIKQDGFTFDYSGHLLHIKNQYTLDLMHKLLGKNINRIKRNAWVYLQNTYVPFPFQTNLYGLNKTVITECVSELLKTYKQEPDRKKLENFKSWALANFGSGICKYFMFPYNEKLWGELDNLTANWCGKFVPNVNLEDIVKGAYSENKKAFGYNSYFFYPKEGGCGAIVDSFASKLKKDNIKTNCEVEKINLAKKVVRTSTGEIKYKNLISTMPLKNLLKSITDLPAKYRTFERKLKSNTVFVFNFAINREIKPSKHWIYFPEDKYVFYRIGFQSSFSPSNAPKGTTSFYVEISGKNNKGLEQKIIKQMESIGILEKSDKILTKLWQKMEPAYCIYNKERETIVPEIISYLNSKDIYPTGRYATWEYSFMEQNILDSKTLAKKL